MNENTYILQEKQKFRIRSNGEPEARRNRDVKELRFFLMREHIQQVPLSELMTSWSHILPPPPIWWDRGGGKWEVCACEGVRE